MSPNLSRSCQIVRGLSQLKTTDMKTVDLITNIYNYNMYDHLL